MFTPEGKGYHFRGRVATGELIAGAVNGDATKVASHGNPNWNQIHAFLQQMARLREVADWAACMAVKHARRAFPAPGLLSRQAGTGYEGQRATPLPRGARRRLGPQSVAEAVQSTPRMLWGAAARTRANTDYPLTLSKPVQ